MDSLQKTVATLPHTPGVYRFYDKHNVVVYVGKARDLKNRVSQYFVGIETLPTKTHLLVDRTASIKITLTPSEFEAILLEAKLIRKYNPKYNLVSKDDKSPIYIRIGKKSQLPHVELARKPKEKMTESQYHFFGPFQTRRIARSILTTLRRGIPFCMQKYLSKKPCFYTQLGFCNPCPSEIINLKDIEEKKKKIRLYRANIKRLVAILSGSSKTVLTRLEGDMISLAKQNKFEQAQVIRDQLQTLIHILNSTYDPFRYESQEMFSKTWEDELGKLQTILRTYFPRLRHVSRIECIDVSNFNGKQAVGSLVVCSDGILDSSAYRRFKIQSLAMPHDPGMMAEVVKRRFAHTEWPMPDLLILDGGKTQIRACKHVLATLHIDIPIIGLTKRREEILIEVNSVFHTIRLALTNPTLHLLIRIRNESHRFAIAYHKKLRSQQFAGRGANLVS